MEQIGRVRRREYYDYFLFFSFFKKKREKKGLVIIWSWALKSKKDLWDEEKDGEVFSKVQVHRRFDLVELSRNYGFGANRSRLLWVAFFHYR